MAKITHVVKRTGAVVPFNKERITNAIYRAAVAVGGRDRSTAEGLADQVVAMLEETTPPDHTPTVEEIQDVVEKVLIENGHARTAKAYILYRDERARQRLERAKRSARPSENIPWRKIWEVLNWAVDHDLHTVERLNARIARKEFPQIVRETGRAYNEDITTASEIIGERRDQVKIVIIAGPSSSGKTTTTIKLSHLLKKMGLSLVPLTVDNYFFDLELHPKDEFGDYDFETPQALDLALIDEHLVRLIAGEEVRTPFYDFKTGRRHDEHTPMQIGPNDVILIDSLHGLYADMTRSVDAEQKFKLYIEPLLQMKDPDGKYVRWTDLRLMRRMVRDAAYRAYDPQRTLEHWHYVRSSELRNIIPYVNTTDYIVNSALPYELPIMRARLFDHFEQWMEQYQDDPLRQDARRRAERVYHLLKAVTPVEDESAIPPDSLLREFIGGSCYEY
ncbi:MAG TPA: ATP cone domain-containing protein [Anaerolineae bacterium]|nr:ATP cone domain-containing protein [Anaerolineae bacterium]